MALLGNYSSIFKSPGNNISNVGVSNTSPSRMNPGNFRARFYGECWLQGTADYIAVPSGYYPPYTLIIAPKEGGIGCNLGIVGKGNISGIGAMGIYRTSTITGNGSISDARLGLIISAIATLTGNSTLSANVNATLELAAKLAGNGQLTAAIRAIGHIIAEIIGNGTINTTIIASGELVADITPYTPLSPESLASSLWNSLAAQYNNPGTMGNKLNSAGAAGDPWTASLPGSYVDGTAGKILSNVDKKTSALL